MRCTVRLLVVLCNLLGRLRLHYTYHTNMVLICGLVLSQLILLRLRPAHSFEAHHAQLYVVVLFSITYFHFWTKWQPTLGLAIQSPALLHMLHQMMFHLSFRVVLALSLQWGLAIQSRTLLHMRHEMIFHLLFPLVLALS